MDEEFGLSDEPRDSDDALLDQLDEAEAEEELEDDAQEETEPVAGAVEEPAEEEDDAPAYVAPKQTFELKDAPKLTAEQEQELADLFITDPIKALQISTQISAQAGEAAAQRKFIEHQAVAYYGAQVGKELGADYMAAYGDRIKSNLESFPAEHKIDPDSGNVAWLQVIMQDIKAANGDRVKVLSRHLKALQGETPLKRALSANEGKSAEPERRTIQGGAGSRAQAQAKGGQRPSSKTEAEQALAELTGYDDKKLARMIGD